MISRVSFSLLACVYDRVYTDRVQPMSFPVYLRVSINESEIENAISFGTYSNALFLFHVLEHFYYCAVLDSSVATLFVYLI